MSEYKTAARIIGVLFIVASVTAIVGGLLLLPAVGSEYLADAAAAEGQVISGVLLEVVLAVSVIGIAVMFFPVLKRQNQGMALGYVGVRVLEGVLILAATVSVLLLLTLSWDYGHSGVAGVEPLGATLLAAREWTYLLGTMLMFSVSALILYTLLYRSNLIPAWLSVWGLIGGVLLLVRALSEMYGVEFSGAMQVVLAAPIGLNEMVLAVWLIVKGFSATPRFGTSTTTEPQIT